MSTQDDERRQLLKSVAEAYFQGLQQQDFSFIPYDENVTLRAPLSPGRPAHEPCEAWLSPR